MEAKMTWKKTLYFLLVVIVAGGSALTGAFAGGFAVYKAIGQNQAAPSVNLPLAPANSNTTNPNQTLVLNSTDVETAVTQSVQKVGPAVVTIVGTIPGQQTIFGQTSDAKVSGSGFFISDKGYIVTNNHVVNGTQDMTIILSD